MRTTLSDIKNSRIPSVLGMCASDARIVSFANEAQQRLLIEGHWWGTTQKFRICASEGCITMPPQIATIEKAAICKTPIPIHDQWFEFLANGAGLRDSDDCWQEANYQGQFPTFAEIIGVNKKLRFVCDLVGDVGKQVLALGYDENGNWIRTNQSGTILDGELITLAQAPGANSTTLFSSITDLQFPENMDGQTWLYEYNTTTGLQRMIGKYEYWETRPSYARYFFPSIKASCTSGTCTQESVEVIGKLEFVPVKKDTDYLIVGNVPAMKEMMTAINRAENEPDSEKANNIILKGLAVAKSILDKELAHYLGDGRTIGIDLVGSSIATAEPIETLL